MVRRNQYQLLETIISSLKAVDEHVSYETLGKQTHIKITSLKKWLKIIILIQTSAPSIKLTADGIIPHLALSNELDDINTLRYRIKKREEDPKLQEFLFEFKGVLTKIKSSLEDEDIKNYPQLNARPRFSKILSQPYSDLQTELNQVLERGISYLRSADHIKVQEDSRTEDGFLQELKQAVSLGIENLEQVVVTDYREKKGRVNAMKMELEQVFKAREERLRVKETN